MRRVRSAVIAALALLTLLVLSGCEARGAVEVLDADRVRVDGTVWDRYEITVTSEDGTVGSVHIEPCFGLRSTDELVAEPLTDPADPRRLGCRLVGVLKPASVYSYRNLSFLAATQDRTVLLVPADTLARARTTGLDADEGRPVPGQVFDLTVTFPGQVLLADPSGHVDGNTVHWTDASAAEADGLRAIALREGVLAPDTLRAITAAAGAVLGALLAAVALVILGRRRRSATSQGSATPEAEPAPDAPEPRPAAHRDPGDESLWASDA